MIRAREPRDAPPRYRRIASPRDLKDDARPPASATSTRCCTEVCPEHIGITDNAIIPLKERVADEYYDPIRMLWRKLRGQPATPASGSNGHAGHIAVSDEAAALDAASPQNQSAENESAGDER